MIATVHLADVGARRALGLLRRTPAPGSIAGLRHADIGLTAPLNGSVLRHRPQVGRVGLVAFWDDHAAADAFEQRDPLAAELATGWSARLEPLRAFGTWPGLPGDVTRSRAVVDDIPVVVTTLGRLRFSQAPRFFRTSAKAEGAALASPGMVWGTALAKPPFVATVSLWRSAHESAAYAFERTEAAHPRAIVEDRRKGFHHQEAFIRFRPVAVRGSLGGRNPLSAAMVSPRPAA